MSLRICATRPDGNVTFSSTLDGGQDLNITAGTGDVTFAAAVGTTTRLGTATIVSAHDVTVAADEWLARLGLAWSEVAVIGDDWPDLPLLSRAAFA